MGTRGLEQWAIGPCLSDDVDFGSWACIGTEQAMEQLILRLTGFVKNPASAAILAALPTMLVSFFNWGLGLIFGALLARQIGEHAQKRDVPINYPLVGACGYLGLMVWHGGSVALCL